MSNMITPQWYKDAKARGDSPERLRLLVRDFCEKTLRDHNELEDDEHIPDSFVQMTCDMYEISSSSRGE